jgi:hypothetical protein
MTVHYQLQAHAEDCRVSNEESSANRLLATVIAICLGIHLLTVKKHLEQIYDKFGVENRASAALRVREASVKSNQWPRINTPGLVSRGVNVPDGTRRGCSNSTLLVSDEPWYPP